MKKILITGGPSTGKSTLVSELENNGLYCFHEISRELTQKMRKKGFDQFFLTNPIDFSKDLFKLRLKQYKLKINSCKFLVYDRGPIDVIAYLNFKGIEVPDELLSKSKKIDYDYIFILRPWKEIYVNDSERHETFDECLRINKFIQKTYERFNFNLLEIPKFSVNDRVRFIKKIIGYD